MFEFWSVSRFTRIIFMRMRPGLLRSIISFLALAKFYFKPSHCVGKSCETISSPCQALQPCLSDAKCFDDFENSSSGYHCECPLGRKGSQCEETSNPCSQVNCQNGGTCLPDPTTDAGISLAARYPQLILLFCISH